VVICVQEGAKQEDNLPIVCVVGTRTVLLLKEKAPCRFISRGLTRTGKQMASFRIAIIGRSQCPVCFVCGIRCFTDEKQNRRDFERSRKGIA
jgi:hypothetical protein